MNILRLSVLVLCCCTAALGAEPAIRLPASPVPVAPVATTELSADAIFVIECDSPCLVLASRAGFVSITEEAGPLRIRGRFADSAKVESRTYKSKQIWIIEAAVAGEVELLVVPVGAKDESTIIRRTLLVGGVIQQPRPTDPIIPKPDPPKPDPIPTALGLVSVVKDSVLRNVPAAERAVAAKFATNYQEGAKQLANGSWSVDKAFTNQLALNRKETYKVESWLPVFRDVADVLAAARDAGKLTTQKQYVAAWAELSLAFAEAGK